MNEPRVSKMKQMKLYGMHNAFKTAIESGRTDHYEVLVPTFRKTAV
ncbi:MAG: hypothetical protein WCJ72_14495 [Chryseobacterium sp.]